MWHKLCLKKSGKVPAPWDHNKNITDITRYFLQLCFSSDGAQKYFIFFNQNLYSGHKHPKEYGIKGLSRQILHMEPDKTSGNPYTKQEVI